MQSFVLSSNHSSRYHFFLFSCKNIKKNVFSIYFSPTSFYFLKIWEYFPLIFWWIFYCYYLASIGYYISKIIKKRKFSVKLNWILSGVNISIRFEYFLLHPIGYILRIWDWNGSDISLLRNNHLKNLIHHSIKRKINTKW